MEEWFTWDTRNDEVYINLSSRPAETAWQLDDNRRLFKAADGQPVGIRFYQASLGLRLEGLPPQAALILADHDPQGLPLIPAG